MVVVGQLPFASGTEPSGHVVDGGRALLGGCEGGGSTLVGGGVDVLGAPSKKRGEQLLGGSVLSQVVHHAVLPSGLVWQHLTVRSPKFSHLYADTLLYLGNEL